MLIEFVVEALFTVKSREFPPLHVAKSGSFIVSISVASGNAPNDIGNVEVAEHPFAVTVKLTVKLCADPPAPTK